MAKKKKSANPAVGGVDMDAETISRQPIGDARNATLSNRKKRGAGDLGPEAISRQPQSRGDGDTASTKNDTKS